MSQADIDAFVHSAGDVTLTPTGVIIAVVTKGIPVNARSGACGWTALRWAALFFRRRELAAALLAVGADPDVKDTDGRTSVWWAAYDGTADILQLLIEGGGNVNEPDDEGRTPLIALLRYNMNNDGDAAARLQVLLPCPELNLNTEYDGRTAEEWAVICGHSEFVAAIARRKRWSTVRHAWVAWVGREHHE